VLLSDDDRERLFRDEEILAAIGYEPVGFTRPADALAACRSTPERFDVLVVGQTAPAQAVLTFAAALHEQAPDLPILLATAAADAMEPSALAAAGIREVVSRPLDPAEIAAALRRCLAAAAPAEDQHL
jgi:DNA-binding NtrC family response regulator